MEEEVSIASIIIDAINTIFQTLFSSIDTKIENTAICYMEKVSGIHACGRIAAAGNENAIWHFCIKKACTVLHRASLYSNTLYQVVPLLQAFI